MVTVWSPIHRRGRTRLREINANTYAIFAHRILSPSSSVRRRPTLGPDTRRGTPTNIAIGHDLLQSLYASGRDLRALNPQLPQIREAVQPREPFVGDVRIVQVQLLEAFEV